MDLSRDHFSITIEEAETAIQQYFIEHYFIRLNRPRRIKKMYSSGIVPPDELKKYSSGIASPRRINNFIRRELSHRE